MSRQARAPQGDVKKSGAAKMDWAIDYICSNFRGVNAFFNREDIEKIIQRAFDNVEQYASTLIENLAKRAAENGLE